MKFLSIVFLCAFVVIESAIDLAPKPDLSAAVDLSELIEKDMKENPYLYDTMGIPDDIDWHNLDLKTWKRSELQEEKLLDEVPELVSEVDHNLIFDHNSDHEIPKTEL